MKSNSTTSKQWISTLVLSLLLVGGYAQVIDKLKMVWNDEFNGNSLDSTKWSPAPEWPRQGGCRWSHENFDMTGKGQVRLQVTEQNNSVLCGAIRTRNLFDKKYGYFEVRCTVPEIHGGWGAFWLMPYTNKPGKLGNDGTEIDVFESINGWNGKINHALHWDGYNEEHKKDSISLNRPDLYDGKYHVFGMMWTPKEYIFYIDNKETWRTTSGEVSDVNQYLKLTLEVSDGNWAGNWKNQVNKPIDWLIDYVRVYDYQPIEVDLSFSSLTDGQSFHVGDQVQMHVDVSGPLSQIDEIRFTTQKGDEAGISQKISKINGETTYWFNWFPNKPGSYKLKALGYKSEIYVTDVSVNVIVIDNLGALKVAFASLKSGDRYTTGEKVKMDVILTGNLLQADQIQYLTKQGDGAFAVQKTETLNNASVYFFNWTPTSGGTYLLRVTALKDGKYVTHVVAGDIKVEEDLNPLSLQFATLSSGTTYQTSNSIPMHIELSGDLSDADEIRFMTKMADGDFIVQNTVNIGNAPTLWYNWSPTKAGTYVFRATAYKNNNYITHVVVNDILVEDPMTLKYTVLQSGTVYKVGARVKLHVELSGDYANTDLIKFISKRSDGSISVLKKSKVSPKKALYMKKWRPSVAGKYKLTVIAYNSGSKVAHIAADITVKDRDSY